jgi:hypothetical protein
MPQSGPSVIIHDSSSIIAEICANCGYIIEMYAAKPEKFKPR